MKYRTVQEAKMTMLESGKNWRIPFMEFVDDLRRTQDHSLIEKPLHLSNENIDSLQIYSPNQKLRFLDKGSPIRDGKVISSPSLIGTSNHLACHSSI